MKKRKLFSVVLAAAMLATMAAGCGNSGKKGSGSNENQIVWLSQGVGDTAWEGITPPILEAYEKETGTKVVGEFYSFNDLFEVIEVKIAAGSSDYDVISVDVPMVAAYATRDYILPMDEYFTDEEKAQFIDSAVEAGSWDGKFYAPPENTSTQVLWYNQRMLKEAGLTLPDSTNESRLTWEQVADLAKQAQKKLDPDGSKGLVGLDWQQVSRVYQMNALPNSMGGKNIGDDGFTVKGVIDNDAWVNSLTWYQGLVNDGIASRGLDADEMSNYFASDKILFLVGGTWTASSVENTGMKKDDYAWAPVPAFEGFEAQVGTPTGSWHFGINKASKNVEKSADFIKYITLGEGNDMWLEINGDMPSRKDKLQEIIDDESAPGYLRIGAYEAMNTSVARALTPGFNEYSTVLNAAWEDIRNGSDVKDSLNDAVKQIDSAMKKYK